MQKSSAPGAVRAAIKTTAKNCKGRYFDWLAGILALIAVRALALLPLLALVCFQKGDPLQYIALLAPVLYVFVVFPLRYSMGEAMERALDGEAFSTVRLISFHDYGQKMEAVMMQALYLLLWALPLVAGLTVGWYLLYQVKDGTEVLRMLRDLGRAFGEGRGMMEAIYAIAAFLGLLFLVLLYGMMRNGMVRFVWLSTGKKYPPARREMLRRLKGRRRGQLLVSLIQCVLLLPVLLPAGYMGYRLLREFAKYMRLNLANLQEPQMLIGLVLVFFLLYLPLLPLRKMLQAAYIRQLKEDKK